jgi:hypothetical protein
MTNHKVVLWVAGLAALASSACASTPAESETNLANDAEGMSGSVCPADVPAAINPAADQSLKGIVNAVGVQVYMCGPSAAAPTTLAWQFVNPQANLLTDDGHLVGTHFIGPAWQGKDASSVVGAKAASATVDSTALPWLLINATSHGDVDGFFSDVTSIQRLATTGGNAPTTGCDTSKLGAILQVPYTAEYAFYVKKTSGKIIQCKGETST